jgi:DNA-binding MarR family transcriptional regulator
LLGRPRFSGIPREFWTEIQYFAPGMDQFVNHIARKPSGSVKCVQEKIMFSQAGSELRRIDLFNGGGRAEWGSKIRELRAGLDALEADMEQSPRKAEPIKQVRALIRARAQRQGFFGTGLFADPAWDILLELYACELSQHRISVSKLCFAVGVPTTTVIRWLALLERHGLIQRDEDLMDRRRVWVSLTGAGLEKMQGYFHSLG